VELTSYLVSVPVIYLLRSIVEGGIVYVVLLITAGEVSSCNKRRTADESQ